MGDPDSDSPLGQYRWLYGITVRLSDYEQLEREQNAGLMHLIGETLASLVKETSTQGVRQPLFLRTTHPSRGMSIPNSWGGKAWRATYRDLAEANSGERNGVGKDEQLQGAAAP